MEYHFFCFYVGEKPTIEQIQKFNPYLDGVDYCRAINPDLALFTKKYCSDFLGLDVIIERATKILDNNVYVKRNYYKKGHHGELVHDGHGKQQFYIFWLALLPEILEKVC